MEKIEVFSLSPSLNYRGDIVYIEWKYNDNYQFDNKDKSDIKDLVEFNLSESGEFEKHIKTKLGEVTIEFKKAISDEPEIKKRAKYVIGYIHQEIKEDSVQSEAVTVQSESDILDKAGLTRYYVITKNGYISYDCIKPPYENGGHTIFVDENGECLHGVTSEILFITKDKPFFFKALLIAVPAIILLVFIYLLNVERDLTANQTKTIINLKQEIDTQKSRFNVNEKIIDELKANAQKEQEKKTGSQDHEKKIKIQPDIGK